ncbi:hypothetical protein CPC08DRAFT_560196 [Agrocybe pediades]|nr:hypothetical protein CPC08DRAFT_560196 [Agrocybe pediades]
MLVYVKNRNANASGPASRRGQPRTINQSINHPYLSIIPFFSTLFLFLHLLNLTIPINQTILDKTLGLPPNTSFSLGVWIHHALYLISPTTHPTTCLSCTRTAIPDSPTSTFNQSLLTLPFTPNFTIYYAPYYYISSKLCLPTMNIMLIIEFVKTKPRVCVCLYVRVHKKQANITTG